MATIDELIKELCPDGVEFKPIKKVYRRLKGTPITATKMKEIEASDGDIRIFAGGKTVIDAYEKDIPKANTIRVPAVLVQSRGVIDAVYYENPFTFKNEMWAYTHENKIAIKFLYYVLKNNMEKFREAASGMGSLPQISLKVTEDFEMPVPPLEIQQEIVRILDQFTELTAELIAKLTAELTARKKQYEYYRDELLSLYSNNFTLHRLGDVCEMKAGKFIAAAEISDDQNEKTPIPCYGGNGVRGYVSVPNQHEDCPIIGRQGALCGNVNYATGDYYATEHAVVVKSNGKYIQRYLFYLLTAMNLNQFKSQGAQPGLSVKRLEELMVPVPSLEEQNRIVSILDRFDTLCNDLTSGLPAEIEARRKQYEYYRDKLLTFKERGTE